MVEALVMVVVLMVVVAVAVAVTTVVVGSGSGDRSSKTSLRVILLLHDVHLFEMTQGRTASWRRVT